MIVNWRFTTAESVFSLTLHHICSSPLTIFCKHEHQQRKARSGFTLFEERHQAPARWPPNQRDFRPSSKRDARGHNIDELLKEDDNEAPLTGFVPNSSSRNLSGFISYIITTWVQRNKNRKNPFSFFATIKILLCWLVLNILVPLLGTMNNGNGRKDRKRW